MNQANRKSDEQASRSDRALLLGLKIAGTPIHDIEFTQPWQFRTLVGISLSWVIIFLLFAWLTEMGAVLFVFSSVMIFIIGPFVFIWFARLLSRFLWCGVDKPRSAKLLAIVSVCGRLSVLFAVIYGWYTSTFHSAPLLIACSTIAWIGLVSDWVFVQTIHNHFVSLSPQSLPNIKQIIRFFFSTGIYVLLAMAFLCVDKSWLWDGKLEIISEKIRILLITAVFSQAFWLPAPQSAIREILRSLQHDSKVSDEPLVEDA